MCTYSPGPRMPITCASRVTRTHTHTPSKKIVMNVFLSFSLLFCQPCVGVLSALRRTPAPPPSALLSSLTSRDGDRNPPKKEEEQRQAARRSSLHAGDHAKAKRHACMCTHARVHKSIGEETGGEEGEGRRDGVSVCVCACVRMCLSFSVRVCECTGLTCSGLLSHLYVLSILRTSSPTCLHAFSFVWRPSSRV